MAWTWKKFVPPKPFFSQSSRSAAGPTIYALSCHWCHFPFAMIAWDTEELFLYPVPSGICPHPSLGEPHALWVSHSFRICFFYLQRVYCYSFLRAWLECLFMDTQEVDRELSRADWVSLLVPFLTPFISKSFPLIKNGLPKVSPEIMGPSSLLSPLIRETMEIFTGFPSEGY